MEMTDEIRGPCGYPAAATPSAEAIAATWRVVAAVIPEGIGALRSRVFPACEDQIVKARQMVWEAQSGHRDRGTAALLASELASNSVAHSNSRLFALAIARIATGSLWLVVADQGCSGFPRLREDAGCGRGLKLVDSLAQRWGITWQAPAGLAVWLECGR